MMGNYERRMAVYYDDRQNKWLVSNKDTVLRKTETKKEAKKIAENMAQKRANLDRWGYYIDIYNKNDDLTRQKEVNPE